jgi:hypothetical protein
LKIERSLHLICNVDVIYSVQGYLHLVRVKCQDVHHSVFSSIAIDNLALVLSVSYFKERIMLLSYYQVIIFICDSA